MNAPWDRTGALPGGGADSLKRCAENGAVFHGSHGAGVEYGPHRFAGFNGQYVEAPADFDGELVVRLKDGKPLPSDVLEAQEFSAVENKAIDIVGQPF